MGSAPTSPAVRSRTLEPLPLLLAIASVALPAGARAGDFVPEAGKVVLAAEDVGLRFEARELATTDLPLVLYDLDFQRLSAELVEGHVVAGDAEAIEGSAAL